MAVLKKATIKSYDAATHKASVQIAGSLAVWLDSVPVATDIPAADVQAGRSCSVLLFDDSNPADAVVLEVHGALPSGSGSEHDHTLHTDRTRDLWLPASLFTPHTGAPALVVHGTIQNAYSSYDFPDAVFSRVVATMIIPADNVGTSVTWIAYYSDDNLTNANIVFKISARVIVSGANPNLTTAEFSTVRTSPQGLLAVSTFVTIGLGSPSPGDMLRVTFGRDGTHVVDLYTGTARFIGARLRYTADM